MKVRYQALLLTGAMAAIYYGLSLVNDGALERQKAAYEANSKTWVIERYTDASLPPHPEVPEKVESHLDSVLNGLVDTGMEFVMSRPELVEQAINVGIRRICEHQYETQLVPSEIHSEIFTGLVKEGFQDPTNIGRLLTHTSPNARYAKQGLHVEQGDMLRSVAETLFHQAASTVSNPNTLDTYITKYEPQVHTILSKQTPECWQRLDQFFQLTEQSFAVLRNTTERQAVRTYHELLRDIDAAHEQLDFLGERVKASGTRLQTHLEAPIPGFAFASVEKGMYPVTSSERITHTTFSQFPSEARHGLASYKGKLEAYEQQQERVEGLLDQLGSFEGSLPPPNPFLSRFGYRQFERGERAQVEWNGLTGGPAVIEGLLDGISRVRGIVGQYLSK